MEYPSDLEVWVVARRTALGTMNYRLAEAGFSERDAVHTAAFGGGGGSGRFPVEGLYRLRVTVEEYRDLTPGEKNLIETEGK